MRKTIKNSKFFSSIFLFLFCLSIVILIPKNSSATNLPNETLKFYSKNNILYYNPLGSLDCYSTSASLAAGNTYEEKIWNYFVSAGIPGVSDNAAVIAGIMGNMKQESGYDPFVQNSLGYTGLYQGDTKSYKTFVPIYNKVNQAVGSNYWFTSDVGRVDSHPAGPTTTAIIIELDALTKNTPETGYGKSFQNFVNNLGRVTNKTPSSYAELFQVEVERGVCNNNNPGADCHSYSQPITDPGVAQRAREYYGRNWPSNGYDYQGMHERMSKAEEIYATYASSTTASTSTSTPAETTELADPSSTPSSDDCHHSSSESFTRWDQTDPKYDGIDYDSYGKVSGGTSSSIRESACGPFSFAMLANALGVQNIDPVEVTKVAGDGGMHTSGSSHEITKYLANHYNMTYEKVNTGHSDHTFGSSLSDEQIDKVAEIISSYLKKGWMIHTSGTSPKTESQMGQPFTPGGHYIGIRGITPDGKWLLADSNGPTASENKQKVGDDYQYTRRGYDNSFKEWDPKIVIKNGMNVGNVHAIRASNVATCGNYTVSSPCGNLTSQGLVIGGMTLAQAQAYMENYKTIAKTNSSKLLDEYQINRTTCSGGSFYNCVAFSQYFIAANTSTGPAGGLPDGKNVVSRLISNGVATDGGHTPQPYAIFSRQSGGKGHGHTGVVLGVTDKSIIIGEADCYGGENGIKAKEIPLEEATSDNYSYAYLNNLTIGG